MTPDEGARFLARHVLAHADVIGGDEGEAVGDQLAGALVAIGASPMTATRAIIDVAYERMHGVAPNPPAG